VRKLLTLGVMALLIPVTAVLIVISAVDKTEFELFEDEDLEWGDTDDWEYRRLCEESFD